MAKDKKLKIANRISFICFGLYLLVYILLPIVEKNAAYLWFLFFPVLYLISLIINLLIKYNKFGTEKIGKISKIAAVFSILLNGFNAGASYVGTMDWDAKEEEIKRYPSITPTWLFIMLFTTCFINGASLFIAYDQDPKTINTWLHFSGTVIIIASIISIIFILIGLISSTFALYYNNGKKDTFRFWKIIIIITLGLIAIAIYSAYANGFSIRDEIQKKQEKETFERHKQNIERTLNNN